MNGQMKLIILVGLLLAGGTGVVWFYKTHEQVERSVRVGPSSAARANKFLAAEKFLNRMGVETTSRRGLAANPSAETLLFLAPDRRMLQRRSKRLLRWVADGGHLVVKAKPHDPLHEPLPVYVEQRLPHEPVRLIEFTAQGELTRQRWISAPHGRGRVTVVADVDAWTNDTIGVGRGAQDLWLAVSGWGPTRSALIVHSDEFPSLGSLLATYAWPVLVSFGALLAVWLWGISRRFGPPLPAPEPERRSLIEHIDAASTFLWRERDRAALLEGVREGVRERLRARRPDLVALDDLPLARAVVSELKLDLPPEALAGMLRGPGINHPDQFTYAVSTLEHLRRNL